MLVRRLIAIAISVRVIFEELVAKIRVNRPEVMSAESKKALWRAAITYSESENSLQN